MPTSTVVPTAVWASHWLSVAYGTWSGSASVELLRRRLDELELRQRPRLRVGPGRRPWRRAPRSARAASGGPRARRRRSVRRGPPGAGARATRPAPSPWARRGSARRGRPALSGSGARPPGRRGLVPASRAPARGIPAGAASRRPLPGAPGRGRGTRAARRPSWRGCPSPWSSQRRRRGDPEPARRFAVVAAPAFQGHRASGEPRAHAVAEVEPGDEPVPDHLEVERVPPEPVLELEAGGSEPARRRGRHACSLRDLRREGGLRRLDQAREREVHEEAQEGRLERGRRRRRQERVRRSGNGEPRAAAPDQQADRREQQRTTAAHAPKAAIDRGHCARPPLDRQVPARSRARAHSEAAASVH